MRSMTFLEMNYNSLLRNMYFNTKLYGLELKLFLVLVELHEQMKSIHLGFMGVLLQNYLS